MSHITTKVFSSTSTYPDIEESDISLVRSETAKTNNTINNFTFIPYKPHIVAKIFKNVNKNIKSSNNENILSSNNDSFSKIAEVTHMERLAFETSTSKTNPKQINLRKNAGLIVFFVFLLIFSITAPLGKNKLI